jgi:hypothetical protein
MPWMLMLSGVRDENSYEHALASFNLGVAEGTWLSMTAGASSAPSLETDVSARMASLGIEHDFGPIGLALTGERWGDTDNLESRDWRGEVFVAREDFRFALTLERRAIDIFFSGFGAPILSDLRRVRIDVDGSGISGRLKLSPQWRIYGSWMEYDYPRGMRLVPRADRLNLLSTSAVTLAYSFVDQYARFGVERAFGEKLLNIDFGQDRSTIDDSRLKSISASVLLPVARRLDLELQLGTSRVDGGSSGLYGGLSLLIYGGH